jgi:hypothetical protein
LRHPEQARVIQAPLPVFFGGRALALIRLAQWCYGHYLIGVPETKISLQGRGKTTMTQSAVKTNGKATEQNAKMEVVKNETKVENAILSLEKRIQKVEELNIVIDKWRKLNEARKNLNGFKLGADGLSSTVIIKDVSGQEFKTSHNIVVETVLKTVKEVLDSKIQEVEDQINFIV